MPVTEKFNKYIFTMTELTADFDNVVAEKIKFENGTVFNIAKPVTYLNSLGCAALITGRAERVVSGFSLKQSVSRNVIGNAVISLYLYRLKNTMKCVGTRVEYKGHTVRSRWECTFKITDMAKLVRYIDANDAQMLGEEDLAGLMRISGGLEQILQQEIKNLIDIMPEGENAEQFVLGYSQKIREKLLEKSAEGFYSLGISAEGFNPTF